MNLTIKTTSLRAQAEGLLLNGSENIVYNVSIGGSGDALQSNGSAYYAGCSIDGSGDIILGRGPSFFKDCEFRSSGGTYMWIRNDSTNHGNVFVNCKFMTAGGREIELARAPTNGGKNYPYCEAVLLNCKLAGISPLGWGPIGGDASNIHYWEYNNTNISDGKPVNINQRHPASRQLTIENDSDIISNYSKPAYVLEDWTPNMAPIILSQPQSVIVPKGREVSFNVEVAAIPEASYQWYINGQAKTGATNAVLTIKTVSTIDAGKYSVTIKNHLGRVISHEATLTVK